MRSADPDAAPRQNILVIGAGVLGTLYAAKLSQAGHKVSLLARGSRLAQLRRDGVWIAEQRSGTASAAADVAVVDAAAQAGACDLALVVVRKTQLASVLPMFEELQAPVVLFLLNNAQDPAILGRAVGHERVVLGFPGAGGALDVGTVFYTLIPEQPITLGELSGDLTPRLLRLVRMFRAAGLATETSRDMAGWLKTHAVLVTAVSGALYLAGGSAGSLARNPALLRRFTSGVREGFVALRAANVTVAPWKLDLLFRILPSPFARAYWRRYFAAPMSESVFARHARAASDEMAELVHECRILFAAQGLQTPTLDILWDAVQKTAERDALAASS